jgi:hypothetical protein
MADTGEILQRLHDSEINGGIDWFFDGVWHWQIGDYLNGIKFEGKADSLAEAMHDLAENAFVEFPRSNFAEW